MEWWGGGQTRSDTEQWRESLERRAQLPASALHIWEDRNGPMVGLFHQAGARKSPHSGPADRKCQAGPHPHPRGPWKSWPGISASPMALAQHLSGSLDPSRACVTLGRSPLPWGLPGSRSVVQLCPPQAVTQAGGGCWPLTSSSSSCQTEEPAYRGPPPLSHRHHRRA